MYERMQSTWALNILSRLVQNIYVHREWQIVVDSCIFYVDEYLPCCWNPSPGSKRAWL